MNLVEAGRLSEEQAREYMESLRWPNGPVCPHCQSQDVTRLNGKAHRPGTIQCNACREQFTVTVGTVMESSKIALHKWVLAFHLLCSSKKGFSACQLQRELGLGSYRTAWFMLHRVRHAFSGMTEREIVRHGRMRRNVDRRKAPLSRTFEAIPRRGTKSARHGAGRARRFSTIKAGRVRRWGDASRRSACEVEKSSTIVTDELASYRIGRHFAGGHETVRTHTKQYVRVNPMDSIHSNTAESFFALVKRGHYGVYHKMSRQAFACTATNLRFAGIGGSSPTVRTEAAIRREGREREAADV